MANVVDDQEVLPGVPAAPKRTVIQSLEKKCLEYDKLCGKRTDLNDEISEMLEDILGDIAKRNLPLYTFRNVNGVLQDMKRVEKLKRQKSSTNPKPNKKDGDKESKKKGEDK